jgi:hypothetical protein
MRNRILLQAGGNKEEPRVNAKCEQPGVQNYAVDYREKDESFYQIRGTIVRSCLEYAEKTGLFREIEHAFPKQQAQQNE